MAVEIERKFLLRSDAWRERVERSEAMSQFYLANGPATSIRIRIAGASAWLNIKGRTIGARRLEFEYPVPLKDARQMQAAFEGPRIDKTRHYLRVGQHRWEVDEFHGDNAGLVVAEIELGAEDEIFARPGWLGAEVTDDVRYYNVSLAERPWQDWARGTD